MFARRWTGHLLPDDDAEKAESADGVEEPSFYSIFALSYPTSDISACRKVAGKGTISACEKEWERQDRCIGWKGPYKSSTLALQNGVEQTPMERARAAKAAKAIADGSMDADDLRDV